MAKLQSLSTAAVFQSVIGDKYYSHETNFVNNSLVRILSGEMKLILAERSYIFRAGDTVLIPRNQLAKISKYPTDGLFYKSVGIYLTQEVLQKYYVSHKIIPAGQGIPQLRILDNHPLLESLFGSLLPYFELSDQLPANIAAIKVEEAISILRSIDKNADTLLGHFEEPGKIDLADFMEKNYMFNMPREQFGYLTGRSLTTFKRDFKKAFNTTPQKWLTRKRLELAHYQIAEQKRRPSDVYFEVGFENLSHFSFAFKKQYGYNPTSAALNK